MSNIALGLVGGVAGGAEPTFDGQPMQPGTHLRWSFAAELGFPPGGFWLFRRAAKPGEQRLPTPPLDGCDPTGAGHTATVGLNPPCYGRPGWGAPNTNGWQIWGVPFTLPVTHPSWPARYFGAPDPTVVTPALVQQMDMSEAVRRLGTLRLVANETPAQQNAHLAELWTELLRPVQGFPTTLLGTVPMAPPTAGANAPGLDIDLMQQLLFLGLNPYFARVLGLYFVDQTTAPGVHYDYAVAGFWGGTPSQSKVVFPGLAPAASLARGKGTTFDSIVIKPVGDKTSLWRWTKFDAVGNYLPRLDFSASPSVGLTVNASLAGLPQAKQPDGLLAAATQSAGFGVPSPPPHLSIVLSAPVPAADVQVAGTGTVTALLKGVVVSTVGFNTTQLKSVTVAGIAPAQVVDEIQVTGVAGISVLGIAIVVGAVKLHRLYPDVIGTRFAMIGPPAAIPSMAAPGQPFSTFRHRQADIDMSALTLVPQSFIDVEWPAPPISAAQQTGDPISSPLTLPPANKPVGFVAQRQDSAVASSIQQIPGWVATRSAAKPSSSKIQTSNLFRLADSELPDPSGGWSHRVAGFDIFGALGHWSAWTIPVKVEKIAAAPTAMRILQFDNTAAGGGAPAANSSAWIGGKLGLRINWSGAAFMMYPDIRTARISVESDANLPLVSSDLKLPSAVVKKLIVKSVVVKPAADHQSYWADIETLPALTALSSLDPGQMLQLTLADGTSERFVVRPLNPLSPVPGPVVARISAGPSSRLVTNTSSFLNQAAYLVAGYGINVELAVPLSVPITSQTARGQVYVTGSTQPSFLVGEQIVDPNGINPPRPEPKSVKLFFTGAQRLIPATPPTPVHQVHHVLYDPGDATGRATKDLPFDTPQVAGVSGYILQRSPVRSIAIADSKRRIAIGNFKDNNPVVLDGGLPRSDLAAWIASLSQWLTAYNQQNATAWTAANILQDAAAQRAFVEHFYGGLLDDELRALADLPLNASGYARVNPQPLAPKSVISDGVDGTGFGRTLYRLTAVNRAGSVSSATGSIGPYYTQIVTPPRAPVLYKLQATESAIIVAWALDANPDVAAYMVYRASSLNDLNDLRYFGSDWTHPAAKNSLPAVHANLTHWPPLSFVQGVKPNIDNRIVGFVPDPRLCVRDYDGSDMGEIILPAGAPPTQVNGIYRLSDYNSTLPPLSQQAFNYWTPPAIGGIAQLKVDSPQQSRLSGLRIGLGRGVPVVVVGNWNGIVRVLGQVPVRRAGFIDGVSANGSPLDANAVALAPPPGSTGLKGYVVVAIDIFGNRSAASKAFSAQFLSKSYGS